MNSELILRLQPDRDRSDDDGESNFWEGVSGDDLAIPFRLLDQNGAPVDISVDGGMTDIVGEFTNGSGDEVTVKYSDDPTSHVTLVEAPGGRGILIITAEISSTLATDKCRKQTFSIYTMINGLKTTWVADHGLLLRARPVPATS